MTLAAQIQSKIKKLPEGKTFGYADLGIAKEDFQTAAKALGRLQTKGIIKKLSKGVFYKPEQTVFGELQPDYSEQLRLYLFENGKRIAYETGYSLYNRMGLTKQMAFRIKIASRSKRISINRGLLKADAVKSYAEVTEANYELLGFLDAIKDIKRIPDCSVSKAVKILSGKIKKLSEKQISDLVKYALLYPTRVRALTGAMLENLNIQVNTEKLKQSLNPLTKVKLSLKETELPTMKNWNIE
jgi:predicted transcriptional regulator of viral defense system